MLVVSTIMLRLDACIYLSTTSKSHLYFLYLDVHLASEFAFFCTRTWPLFLLFMPIWIVYTQTVKIIVHIKHLIIFYTVPKKLRIEEMFIQQPKQQQQHHKPNDRLNCIKVVLSLNLTCNVYMHIAGSRFFSPQ